MIKRLIILLMLFAHNSGSAQERKTITTDLDITHELISIPASDFVMGLSRNYGNSIMELLQSSGEKWRETETLGEQPQHTVFVDEFSIFEVPVTLAQYITYLRSSDKAPDEIDPIFTGWWWTLNDITSEDLQNPYFSGVPANPVSWFGAQSYCESIGLRLPTEAEWEKAARGEDGRRYPWGDEINESHANYGTGLTAYLALEPCVGDFLDCHFHESDFYDDSDGFSYESPVGAYPSGASPYGVLDMAGNIHEWVWDWYDENYYSNSSRVNPTGPTHGTRKTLKGCSFECAPFQLRASKRNHAEPNSYSFLTGFRCVDGADITPTTIQYESWGKIKLNSTNN